MSTKVTIREKTGPHLKTIIIENGQNEPLKGFYVTDTAIDTRIWHDLPGLRTNATNFAISSTGSLILTDSHPAKFFPTPEELKVNSLAEIVVRRLRKRVIIKK